MALVDVLNARLEQEVFMSKEKDTYITNMRVK